jgi:SAM-dependent methyltransferase
MYIEDEMEENSFCDGDARLKTQDFFNKEDFARDDDRPDAIFYTKPRLVQHLDSLALSTVEDLLERLIPTKARILDLMSGPDSHIRPSVEFSGLVGLGMNLEELEANAMLTDRIVFDVNQNPNLLPFPDNDFDTVVNTVSVDYIVHPIEIFQEVSRILKPDGLFIVIFSNRMFPPKAVKIWKTSSEFHRMELVKKFFSLSGCFSIEGNFESKGKPRPKDDKYYSYGIPSDPIYAVWGKPKK